MTAVAAFVAVLAGLVTAGCGDPRAGGRIAAVRPVYPPYPNLPVVTAAPKFQNAIDSAHVHGLRVWLESDLVARWRAGSAQFELAVGQLASLAARPGVVGIKIADELGSKGGLSRKDIMRFLRDSRAALHANAPGKLILIDIIGYQLGCAPRLAIVHRQSATCNAKQRAAHPAVTLATIDAIVASGYVDVIDLTTNMDEPGVYQSWGITRAQAQRAAFAEAHRRGWDSRIRLQTRKALAFPTQRIPGAATAAALVPDFVDVPISAGVRAVDIWTFSQNYAGRRVHLTDPGLKPNVLWAALLVRRGEGDVLFTHYSPSAGYGPSLSADMQAIATVFTDVFCAAGTG
ncbi:MAG: hypothetical protein QOJ62_161 [Actinomycetota bacterium]|jgi:hypothetical protein|nr:hypothetical protein [Actinomycetota bacterium]